MKKITLFLAFLIFFVKGYGQLTEGFEGAAFPPTDWITLHTGPATPYPWAQITTLTAGAVHSGDKAAWINRGTNTVGSTITDWLITKQVAVPTNGQLRFFTKQATAGDQGTLFQIRVSSTSQNLETDYTVIQQWTELEMNVINYNTYEERVVNFTAAYQNQNVYIAFVKVHTQVGAIQGERWFLDDVRVVEQCLTPTAGTLPAQNITANSANLSWTGTSSGWDVELLPGVNTPATGTVTHTGTTNPLPVSGLTPSTNYTYYVRGNCSGITSEWAGPFNFTTTQIPAPLNFTENFEGTPQWTLNNGTQTNKWAIGTAANNGGTHALYISTDNGTTNTYNLGTTSVVHAYRDIQMPAAVDQLGLVFDWKGMGESTYDYLRVWIIPSTFSPVTGVQLTAANSGGQQIGGNLNNSATFANATYVIPAAAYSGQIVRLVFEWRNDNSAGTQPPAVVDNISLSLITCPGPSGLAMSGLGQNGATLTWNPITSVTPTYDYYLSQTNTAPNGTTVPTGNVTPATITFTTLTPSTTYYYWVRTNCGGDNGSLWTGPISFTTTQIPGVLNYTDGFEGTNQWTLNNGTQTNKWVVGTAVNNGGTHSLYISNDNGATNTYSLNATSVVHAYRDLHMPATVNEINLTFDWKGIGEGTTFAYDYFRVWLVPSSYVPVPGTQITAGNSGGQQYGGTFNNMANFTTQNFIIPAAAYANQNVRVVFEWRNDGVGGTQPPAAIDNVSVSLVTCSAPSAITATGLSQTGNTLNWVAPASGTPTYQYYLSQTNTAPVAATTPTATAPTNTAALTGLTPSTTYYFWVRSNCGADGTSIWTGPYTFTTPQIPATLPYVDGFEGPTQWILNNGTQTNKWIVGTAVNHGGTHALYITNDNGLNNAYTLSATSVVHAYRDIQIPTGTAEVGLAFDWRAVGEGTSFPYDYIRVWIVPVTFVPTTGVQITTGNSGGLQLGGNLNNSANFLTPTYVIPTAAYAGQMMRVIFEWRNDGSGGTQPPGAIDNVNLSVITCPAPTGLLVSGTTSTSADLSWTAGGTETQWQVVVQPQGTGTPTGAGQQVNAANYTVTGLIPFTAYEYYVRAYCSATDQSYWAGPVNFRTAIANDQCSAAVTVPVNPQEVCLQSVSAAFVGATPSAEATTCGTQNSGDIWFQFVAANTTQLIELQNFAGAPLPIMLALYSGDQCGALTQMYCSANNFITASGLVVGQTYKIRAMINSASALQTTTFDICIKTPLPPAGNNPTECQINTVNNDFEFPDITSGSPYPTFMNHNIVPGWRTTASDEMMEFWNTPNYENVAAYSGTQFIELNANVVSGIYQDYETPLTTVFAYGFAHRGRQGTDTCQLQAGPPGGPYVTVATVSTGNTAWSYNTGTYTVPAGQTVTRFIFQSVSSVGGASVGNYLDAINFTANNGILSPNPLALDCSNAVAAIAAAGSGSWIAHTDNPGATTIGNPGANNTTITGFTTSGVYRYDWNTLYCSSTLEITFNGNAAGAPVVADVTYCMGQAATPVSATVTAGNTLNWYTVANGGTASAVAPTPDTSVAGTTTYYVSQTSAAGCESAIVGIVVTVQENVVPVTGFSYDAISYCSNSAVPVLTTVADFTTGGTFSAATGLALDATTGAIDLAASTPGTYDVSYTILPNLTNCHTGGQSNFELTITAATTAVTDFTYNNFVTCSNGTTPIFVAAAGFTTGGTFSVVPTGLIVDSATGAITLSGSSQGSYTITYTYGGDAANCVAGNSSDFEVTVNSVTASVTDFEYELNYCAVSANAFPDTAAGFTPGGVFSAMPSGLSINAVTGELNFSASTAGTYEIKYTITGNAAVCSVDQSSVFSLTLSPDVEIAIANDCVNNKLELTASPLNGSFDGSVVTYTWKTSQGAIVGTNSNVFNVTDYVVGTLGENYTLPLLFTVTITNGDCESTEGFTVESVFCRIPKGLSPNGDGDNDDFNLSGLGVKKLVIFNRYGREVYSFTGAYTNQWHGQSKNHDELPDGTYYYMIEKTNGTNETGWVYINK
ncbi:fibronectin type III domain-containing protein [Flavobacterium kingsejongi]|uniref:Fibronectin type-III domain-containing protein n=1 Tax=Flavobacterium kingsejongi TaxID=1678728 RepID=A0A2S1LK91_9FLAO|nr:fibronectin type III domain-containing protein [Flavobacterium kingsejongi]AWG24190.1 hypothetical protein FK004_02610 [Flavobacterium kingsejongi]